MFLSPLFLFFSLRKEWLIYYSLFDLGVFTFLLKMAHLATQINADLAIFFLSSKKQRNGLMKHLTYAAQ